MPPSTCTVISRSGRRSDSSTSRTGFVKPALVQLSAGSTRCPEAQVGAGEAVRRPRASRRAPTRTTSAAASARVGRPPVPGGCSRTPSDTRAAPGRIAAKRASSGPGSAPSTTHQPARTRRPQRIAQGASTASAQAAPARRAEQHESDDLDEAVDGEGAVSASAAERQHARDAGGDGMGQREVEERLKRQPLRHEAVERRDAGDRSGPDQECRAGPRHAAQQAAHAIQLEAVDGALEGPGAEEEQRLEDGVIDRVQQRGGERDASPGGLALLAQHQRGAEPEQDDADVLDRVQCEQALELVLEQGVDDAAQGGHGARARRPSHRATAAAGRATRSAPA